LNTDSVEQLFFHTLSDIYDNNCDGGFDDDDDVDKVFLTNYYATQSESVVKAFSSFPFTI
jgi:hypothetical protein